MFKYAIVRRPSHSLIDGISQTPEMGKPDYDLALQQHDRYVEILRECGLEVGNAGDSQALIQLKKEYCDRKDCLRCRIGYEYLKGVGE